MDDYLIQKIYTYVEEKDKLLETIREFAINLKDDGFTLDFSPLVSFYDPEILKKEMENNPDIDVNDYESLYDYNSFNFDVKTSEIFKSKYPRSYYISHIKKITNKFIIMIDYLKYYKLNANEEKFQFNIERQKANILLICHQNDQGYSLKEIGDLVKSDLLNLFNRCKEKRKNDLLTISWELNINLGYDGNMIIEVI